MLALQTAASAVWVLGGGAYTTVGVGVCDSSHPHSSVVVGVAGTMYVLNIAVVYCVAVTQ